MEQAGDQHDWGPLSTLPGNPLMWVLIISELLVDLVWVTLYPLLYLLR